MLMTVIKLPFKLAWFCLTLPFVPFKLIFGGGRASDDTHPDGHHSQPEKKKKAKAIPDPPSVSAVTAGASVGAVRHHRGNNWKVDIQYLGSTGSPVRETYDLRSGTMAFNRDDARFEVRWPR